jgi:hypothetical protein
MTNVGPGPASSSAPTTTGVSFVEWGSVLAGAVLAAAISFVLLTFGAAIGLSATSPWPNSGVSGKLIASLAVFWAIALMIGAYMAGGYVAGRMRSRWHETGHEAEFRDGLHGGLVWAVGVVLTAALLVSAVGSAAKTGADIAGQTAAASAASTNDPMGAVLDAMVRPTTASPGIAGAAPATAPRTRAAGGDENRAEMARILAGSVTSGSLPAADRTYLAQLVAQRTGMSQQEAERRVDDAVTAARQAADKARRAAVLTGFVTAASLVLSLGAAWWAAMRGGHHRDHSIPARFEFGEQRRRPT